MTNKTEPRFRLISAKELAEYKEPIVARYDVINGVASFDLLAPGGHWYEIVEDRCDTAPKLVEWIAHMNDKTWVTHDHIRQLIRLVVERHPEVRAFGC